MELGIAQQEGTDPFWYCEIDPLDALFLGSAWPGKFHDEFEFANARDAWLRLLQGTVHGQGIRTFVHEVVATSRELGLPVDDGQLMLAVADRLEAAGLDRRRLPLRLLPGQALEEHRAVRGPAPDLRFPEPPEDAQERVERFWQRSPEDSWEETPLAVLRSGLHRLQDAGLPVEQESCMLLSALYRALLAKPGEPLESLPEHAMAWAFSLDETSTLLPVVDLLAIAPIQGLSTDEVLGRLFAIPAFTETIPSAALLWTSSPGLALPRLAFELGVSEVSTLAAELTPDMLDWVGMHTTM
ncbi:hypothetical protein, partial [Kitasatospora nipponensis]|uniref:hypothetical protein n=1 Tax=Kitasatospora nipponensis TaxID=258049 RepID=UPI0031E06A99